MDYKRDLNLEMDKISCDCENISKILVILLMLMTIITVCTKSNSRRKIRHLKIENETLRRIVMTSIDNMFVNMLKNGSYNDNDDDE